MTPHAAGPAALVLTLALLATDASGSSPVFGSDDPQVARALGCRSHDGRWRLAAHDAPPTVLLFDSQDRLHRTWSVASRNGRTVSRIADIVDARTRRSFIVALRDIAELWEISYDPLAEDFHDGLVHDFRMGEGSPVRGFLNPRRIAIPEPLSSLYVDDVSTEVVGLAYALNPGKATLHWINLDVRRRVALLPLDGTPLPGAGIGFDRHGLRLLALPHAHHPVIDVIDVNAARLIKHLVLPAGDAASAWLVDPQTLATMAAPGTPAPRCGAN